ncbi:MFS transporter [Arthrobacter antioxidans]|uniref:MFS transporter n=1 Tax=Arthrobacter antioxidans TaxID=2895818 RepID=UPI001FFEDA13|nr:MFS transporter [Arthrobacter antioxidans]
MKRSLQSPVRPHPLLFATSGVALIAVTYGLARLGYGLFLPAFSAAFPLTPAVSGLLASGASILYCVSAGIGFRHASLRPRGVAGLAGLSAALGSLGVAAAPSTPVFVGGVLLAGMGAGFASPAMVELVRRNADSSAQGRLQSVVNSGTGFGVVLAGALSLVLGEAWRLAWVLVAVLAAASMLAVLRLDRSSDRPSARPAGRWAAPSLVTRSSVHGLARPLCGALVFGSGSAAVWVYGRATLEQAGGMGVSLSAGAWIALGLGGAGAAAVSRRLAEHSIRVTWPLSTLVTAAATALVGTAPGSLLLAYAAAFSFGLAYTAATSVLILWASAVAADSAAGTSVLFIALVLGQAAGASLTGLLLQEGTAAAFLVAALACATSAVVAVPTTAGVARVR